MNKFDELYESVLNEKKIDWSTFKDKWINQDLINDTLNSLMVYKDSLDKAGLSKEVNKRITALALNEITLLKKSPPLLPSHDKKLESDISSNFDKLNSIMSLGNDTKTGFIWKGKTENQIAQFFKYLINIWGL